MSGKNERHMQTELRPAASEESLDDWYAQSLGIPYDKLVKQKKLLKKLMSSGQR